MEPENWLPSSSSSSQNVSGSGGTSSGVGDVFTLKFTTPEHTQSSSCTMDRYLPLIFVNLWSALSNLFVVCVMALTPSIRRTFGGVMLSIAVADLSTSILVIPPALHYSYKCSRWEFGSVMCGWWSTAHATLTAASISHHCTIAINRYFAIAKPHEHNWLRIAANAGILYRIIFPSWMVGCIVGVSFGAYVLVRPESMMLDHTSGQLPGLMCQLNDGSLAITLASSSMVAVLVIVGASSFSIWLLRRRLQTQERYAIGLVSTTETPTLAAALVPPVLILTPPTSDRPGNPFLRRLHLLRSHMTGHHRTLARSKMTLTKLVSYYLTENDYFGSSTPSSWSQHHMKASVSNTSVTDATEEVSFAENSARLLSVPSMSPSMQAAKASRLTVGAGQLLMSTGGILMEAIREDDEPDNLTPASIHASGRSVFFVPPSPSKVSFTSLLAQDFDESLEQDAFEQLHAELNEFMTGNFSDDADDEAFLGSDRDLITKADSLTATITADGSQTAKKKSIASSSSLKTPVSRKRAFSVDLPVSYLFFQQAPLAQFEQRCKKGSLSSTFDNHHHKSGMLSGTHYNNNANNNRPNTLQLQTQNSQSSNSSKQSKFRIDLSSIGKGRMRFNTQPAMALSKIRRLGTKKSVIQRAAAKRSPVLVAKKKRAASIPNIDISKHHIREMVGLDECDEGRQRGGVDEEEEEEEEEEGPTISSMTPPEITPVEANASPPASPYLAAIKARRARGPRLSTASTSSAGESFEIGVSRLAFCDHQRQGRVCLLQRAASVVSSLSSDSLKQLRNTFKNQRRLDAEKPKKTSMALERFRRRERQTERALFLVLFFFLFLWLPFFITLFVLGVCPSCINQEILNAFTWCGFATGAVNPLVYTVFNRQFKNSAKLFVYRVFCCRRLHKPPTVISRRRRSTNGTLRSAHSATGLSSLSPNTIRRIGIEM